MQFMDNELSYLTPEGYTVFTSKFLKNRGTCCKAACLHCPYGFTVKKLGIQFADITEEHFAEVDALSNMEWKSFYPDNAKLIIIKDVVAGVLFKNHIVIKHFFLKKHFQNMSLSRELLEAYLF